MHEVIRLQSGDCSAMIDPIGAQCMQFSHHPSGISVLHTDDEKILSGIPILFPVNRIDGGRFGCAGVQYQLPINEEHTGCSLHGTLYTELFSVTEQSDTDVTLRYGSGGRYPGFPQEFSVEITYTLADCALCQTAKIRNHAGSPLPVLLGFHTSIAIPFCPGSKPEDITVKADLAASLSRNERHLTVGRVPSDAVLEAFREGTYRPCLPISRQFLAGADGSVILTDHRTGVRVRYTPDPLLRYRMMFSGAPGYFCPEPQTCAVNAPNMPAGDPDAAYPVLFAGEELRLQTVLALEGI